MRRHTLWAFGLIVLILAALASKSLLLSVPAIGDRSDRFDALRAKARLAVVLGDQEAHPADSAADDAVRQRIVNSLEQMGLKPIVRDQAACNDFRKARLIACARVRNVIAVLGPATGKALLLSAHYDSVPVGPGASDDGIGVATLLEVASILKHDALRRPVIFLFNEGEELGLIGARAFLADPLSRNVDSLLNFEARGVNGPATMFETSEPNGAPVAAYARSVRRPLASSLSTNVARLIPNDTDVTTFKERGWLTLNTAVVGNETRYHSAGDNLEGLDSRSLQDMGNQALATASMLSRGLSDAGGNRIFFDIAQRFFIQLPLAAGGICLVALLAAFCWLAIAKGASWRALVLVPGALIGGCALGGAALFVMGLLRHGTYWRAHPELTFNALYATILVGELAIFFWRGPEFGRADLRLGYWLAFLLLGGILALLAPGAIIYFLIPPALVLAGNLTSRWYPPAETAGAILGVLFLFVTWGELLAATEELFSPGPLWVVAPAAAIIIAPILVEASSLFRQASRTIFFAAAGLLAFICWLVAGSAPAYAQDHQQRFTIEHVTEFPSRRSYWSILNDGLRLPSAYRELGVHWRRGRLEYSERERWLALAPAASGIDPPTVTVRQVSEEQSSRTIMLHLETRGSERIVITAPGKAHVLAAGYPGLERPMVDEEYPGRFTLTCTGRSCNGADLVIRLRDKGPVEFTIIASRNGLPEAGSRLIMARPSFARAQYVPDETVTIEKILI